MERIDYMDYNIDLLTEYSVWTPTDHSNEEEFK